MYASVSTFFAKNEKAVPKKGPHLKKTEMEGTVRYHVEWPGGSCYFDADDDGEATERARDLVEDMGREADVTVLDDGRYLGRVVAERIVQEERERLEALGL